MNHCHILNRQIQQYYLTILLDNICITDKLISIRNISPAAKPSLHVPSISGQIKLSAGESMLCCIWCHYVVEPGETKLMCGSDKKTKLRWLHTKWSSSQFESTYDTTPEHKTSCTQTCILVYVHLSFTANFSKALRVWMHDCAHMWVLEHVHVCLALTVITKQ